MPNATVRANARPMPEPKPGSVASIRRQTDNLKSATALLKVAQVVDRDLGFDRAYSRWFAALAKRHNPDGMDDETEEKRREELKRAERELVFTPATQSDMVWEKIQVLSLCLEEESTLGRRADHFSLLALAAIKPTCSRLASATKGGQHDRHKRAERRSGRSGDREMKVRQLSHLTSIVSEWATDRSMYPETDDLRSDQLSRLMFAVDEIAQKAADLDRAFHSAVNAAFTKPAVPDPVLAAIERSRAAWLALGSVLTQADEAGKEPDEGELAAAHAVDTEALDNLLKIPPETLAGARSAIAWLVKVDYGSVPERSGKYMETLLRSPIFAPEGRAQ